VTYTDWHAAKTALELAKSNWLTNGITSYAYHWRSSCFCMYCWIAPRYIVISGRTTTSPGSASYVEFDEEALAANPYQTCSNVEWIQSPLSNNYHPIDYYYDRAIAWADRGIQNCDTTTTTTRGEVAPLGPIGDFVCGGSITFAYDDTYYYPTQISLAAGPYIADAGQSWSFQCLTPLSEYPRPMWLVLPTLRLYSGECVLQDGSKWAAPSIGDECGRPGEDCQALRCLCGTCPNGDQYGCCSTCTIQESSMGELLCSAMIPKPTVCPDLRTNGPAFVAIP